MESFCTEKLIDAVEKHPCIYARSTAEYRNKLKRAKAWDSIGKAMNIEGFECMSKWRSIRDRYAREVSKVLRSGTAAEIQSSYQHMEQLSFLKLHVLPRKTISSVTVSSESNVGAEFVDGFVPINHLNESSGSLENLCSPVDIVEEAEARFSFEDEVERPSTLDSSSYGRCFMKIIELHEQRVQAVAAGKHEAFLQLVKTKLDVLPTEDQEDANMFF